MPRRTALALWLALTLALPLNAAVASAPAAAAPVPLTLINAQQFAGTQYLIITPSAYVSTMQSIADWKTQKGVFARVAALEDVEASYPGRDNAEKVHEFLQDVYFNGTHRGLAYVVLGGGSALMPVRYLHANGTQMNLGYGNDDIPSDIYFAGLSNDWDANHNGTYGEYGEEDWDAEVYVGRLPFNNLVEAGYMRDNLLSYERTPLVGAWMQSAAAFASVMAPPNLMDGSYTWYSGNALRSVRNTQAVLPSTMSLDLLADYYELDPGNYSPAQDRLNSANIMSSLDAGKSVVISVTHGYVPTGRGVPEFGGVTGTETVPSPWKDALVAANASALSNNGMLSFGYFSSCFVGNFADPTLPTLARLVVQDNHGFVAMIAPTDGTLRGEDDFAVDGSREGNWWQSENFWSNFFNGSDPFRPGPALYEGIRDYQNLTKNGIRGAPSWGGYSNQKAVYNLLGDPEVPIWTAVAQSLNATLPAQVYAAESHFRATITDALGRPAAGAKVALTGLGTFAVGTADAQGRVDIVAAPTTTGTLRVTVTLHNFLPLETTVPVVTAPADLAIGRDNVSLPSPVLRTGVAAVVNFTVRNVGAQDAGASDARVLATPAAGLPQVIAASVPLGPLARGTSVESSFNWTPSEDGLWTLDVSVDPGNAIAEFDEQNNEASLDVFASSVDLAFDTQSLRLNPPGEVAPGGALEASGELAVVGLVPRAFLVGFELLRGDGSVAAAGNAVLQTTDAAFALDVHPPEAGAFTLRLTVDAGHEVVEFDESNNVAEFAVRAGQGPTVFALPAVHLDADAPPTRVIGDLGSFVADPDTSFDQLALSASSSTPQLAVWVDGRALVAAPAPGWSGNGTITLGASDGHDATSATTTFAVTPRDTPPSVEALPPQSATIGVPFVLQVVAEDVGGGPLTFASSSTGPETMRTLPIDADGRIAFVPPPDMAGSWTFTVSVRDAAGHAASVDVTFFVRPLNHPPALSDLGTFEVRRGENTTIRLAATDSDGDPLTFSTDSVRASVAADGTMTIDRGQADALPSGESVIPVTVSDGLNATTGVVRLRVVEASPASAPYGADLLVTGTAFAAMVAAAVAVVWVVRKGKSGER